MTLEEENASLKDQLAKERAKNEVLLEQVLQAEDEIADGDVESFSDVIPNEDREFWRGRILENREEAVACLIRMRNRAVPPAAAPAAPKALHNPRPPRFRRPVLRLRRPRRRRTRLRRFVIARRRSPRARSVLTPWPGAALRRKSGANPKRGGGEDESV